MKSVEEQLALIRRGVEQIVTEAAGRALSAVPVERTSTKTMQRPSSATRSSSPCGQV